MSETKLITHLNTLSQTIDIAEYIGPERSALKSTRPTVGDLKQPPLLAVALYVDHGRPPNCLF